MRHNGGMPHVATWVSLLGIAVAIGLVAGAARTKWLLATWFGLAVLLAVLWRPLRLLDEDPAVLVLGAVLVVYFVVSHGLQTILGRRSRTRC
jgi:hypothetical protein